MNEKLATCTSAIILILDNFIELDRIDGQKEIITDSALKTKGRPAILLLDILKCVSFSPMAVMRSESALLDTALRELAVEG